MQENAGLRRHGVCFATGCSWHPIAHHASHDSSSALLLLCLFSSVFRSSQGDVVIFGSIRRRVVLPLLRAHPHSCFLCGTASLLRGLILSNRCVFF